MARKMGMRRTLLAATAVALMLAAAGCSSASKTTCAEYAAMSFSDKTNAIVDMISEHGFDPYSSVWGTAAISYDVNAYCGTAGLGVESATQNQSSAIEGAIDWSTVGK